MQGHHWNYTPARSETVLQRLGDALIFVTATCAWVFAGYVYLLGA